MPPLAFGLRSAAAGLHASSGRHAAADFYAVLGVPRGSSGEDIRKAYLAKAKALHPDTNADDPNAQARFQDVQRAYETLKDRASRQRYDAAAFRSSAAHYPHRQGQSYPGAGPAYTSTPYTYRSGWYQFSKRNNLRRFFHRGLGRVGLHEVAVLLGVVTFVAVGTDAVDTAFASLWGQANSGKLFKDLAATTNANANTNASAKAKKKKKKSRKKEQQQRPPLPLGGIKEA